MLQSTEPTSMYNYSQSRQHSPVKKSEHVYHEATLDPHTSVELSIDDIVKICDELMDVHQE
jgi:alpha-galactosidase/6-phospho-beta-glucosidase family protein